jgi:hypothetical protein
MQMSPPLSHFFPLKLMKGNGYTIRACRTAAVVNGDPRQVQSSHLRKNHSVKDVETLTGTHVSTRVKAVGR